MSANRVLAMAALVSTLAAGTASATDLDVIVDRSGQSVNIFFGMTAEDIAPLFAMAPDSLLRNEQGLLRLEDFQSNGSFQDADRLIMQTEFRIDGAPVDFQAMSMMVHPQEIHVPFETPIDGWIAMSVCGVPPTFADAANEAVRVYAGFNAYPVEGLGELTINFAGDTAATVTLREYREGELLQSDVVQASAKRPLVLNAVPAGSGWASWVPAIVGALALIGLGLIVRGNRRLPRTENVAEA